MGVFEMVVAIVAITTGGKVLQTWFARRGAGLSAGAEQRIQALEAELRTNDARLAQSEERIADLNEKLGFVEDLLAAPERSPRLRDPSR
jgi:cell division protein FtsB